MIPNTLSFLRPAALAAAFLSTVSVQADTTVSNLGETGSSSANFSSATWLAVSFTTDGMGYTLNSVSLDLDAVMDTVTVTPGIYADAAGAPTAAPLETLASQTFSSAGIRSFTSSGLSLAPSTTYWVVAKGGGPGIPVWFSTISANQTGSWTIGDAGLRTSDGGSTWVGAEIGRLSIQATSVPEPGTVGLIALGGVLLVGRRFRRKSC